MSWTPGTDVGTHPVDETRDRGETALGIGESDRRLIIIAAEPGTTLEIDYEGDWAPWEAAAALEEAARMVREGQEEEAE